MEKDQVTRVEEGQTQRGGKRFRQNQKPEIDDKPAEEQEQGDGEEGSQVEEETTQEGETKSEEEKPQVSKKKRALPCVYCGAPTRVMSTRGPDGKRKPKQQVWPHAHLDDTVNIIRHRICTDPHCRRTQTSRETAIKPKEKRVQARTE